MSSQLLTEASPLDAMIFAGYDSDSEAVQKIVQSFVAFAYAINARGARIPMPTLEDIALFWKCSKPTASRWVRDAIAEGAIIKHGDGTVEIVLAEDSPR
jgi:hypothetical protein